MKGRSSVSYLHLTEFDNSFYLSSSLLELQTFFLLCMNFHLIIIPHPGNRTVGSQHLLFPAGESFVPSLQEFRAICQIKSPTFF